MNTIKDKILKRLGFHAKKGILTPAIEKLINEEFAVSKKLIRKKNIIRLGAIISRTANTVVVEGDFIIKSSHVARLLHNCYAVYGIAVTIGSFLEEKRDVYIQQKQTTAAAILDSIGSVAVEECAETIHREITDRVRTENAITTSRYSPGYGDWQLHNQKFFLPWLEAEKINISLTSGFLMRPEKSISAIIGVKRQGQGTGKPHIVHRTSKRQSQRYKGKKNKC